MKSTFVRRRRLPSRCSSCDAELIGISSASQKTIGVHACGAKLQEGTDPPKPLVKCPKAEEP